MYVCMSARLVSYQGVDFSPVPGGGFPPVPGVGFGVGFGFGFTFLRGVVEITVLLFSVVCFRGGGFFSPLFTSSFTRFLLYCRGDFIHQFFTCFSP